MKGLQQASPLFITVANYDHAIKLQVGEQLQITNWITGWGEKFTFMASVVRCEKEILPKKPEDVFKISFYVEMADKDKLPRIVENLKQVNPGKYEDELY